jgi:hypothetical protein
MLLNVLLMWVNQIYCQYTTERLPVAEWCHRVSSFGGVRQHRVGHHNLAQCSLLEATGYRERTIMQHASSCISIMHHES